MFFESLLLNIGVLLILLFALIFDYVTKYFSYWYIRHIPYKVSVPFFGSDYHRVLGLRSNTEEVNKLYSTYPKDNYVGCVNSRIPNLIVKDEDAIKRILVTDFANFHSRGLELDKTQDICLRNNLFYADGEKWTLLKQQLEGILKSLDWKLEGHECLTGINGDVNVQQLLSGLLDSAFNELLVGNNVNSDTLTSIRSSLQNRSLTSKVKTYLKNVFPSLYKTFGITTLSGQPSKKTLETLEKSKLMKQVERFRSLFEVEIKGKYKKVKCDTDGDNAFSVLSMFVTEGYLPVHNLLTAIMFEVSKNPLIQQRIRESDVAYLDKVVNETLRLYPQYSVIPRKCVKAFKFPENGMVIDKKLTVSIPVEALHRDERNFKDATTFNPDRFDNNSLLNSSVFLPFGAGPRRCIGEDLARQIVRDVTKCVLDKYTLESCHKTPASLTMVDHNFGRLIDRDIWLKFKPIA